MKAIVAVAALVLLCGCTPTQEEVFTAKAVIDSQLSEGCEFNYYGRVFNNFFSSGVHISAIVCDGRETSTTPNKWNVPDGKSYSEHQSNVTVIGPKQ